MSYNITRFKVNTVLLGLPRTFDFLQWVHTLPDRDEQGHENVGKRWCLEDDERISVKANLADNTWELEIMNQSLSGVVLENHLAVRDIDWQGDFSGHLYGDILLPLFKEFKGSLSALVVWEGGDSVVRLSITEGEASEVDIA